MRAVLPTESFWLSLAAFLPVERDDGPSMMDWFDAVTLELELGFGVQWERQVASYRGRGDYREMHGFTASLGLAWTVEAQLSPAGHVELISASVQVWRPGPGEPSVDV